jgi:predicted Rossmann fold nucleotide-binding protein DprA/Smf involved in DNA uptake
MEYFGSKEILNNYKIGFLCSRKVSPDIILKTYDWATKQRDEGKCIISGFHSKIEQDVFHFLLKGTQPIIMVLARGMKTRWEKEIMDEVNKKRLLIISPFSNSVKRPTEKTALKRNNYIISIADEMYIPYSQKDGNLEKLQSQKNR